MVTEGAKGANVCKAAARCGHRTLAAACCTPQRESVRGACRTSFSFAETVAHRAAICFMTSGWGRSARGGAAARLHFNHYVQVLRPVHLGLPGFSALSLGRSSEAKYM